MTTISQERKHMDEIINLQSWLDLLPTSINDKLNQLMDHDVELRNTRHKTIYPSHDKILNALNLTGFNNVKAVILGQDPYHEPEQAMGLSFSVSDTVPRPPSLQNIFKEYHTDLGYNIPTTNDLTPWAKEGVLLLNAVLTVEQGKANSHKEFGWQEITSAIIQTILNENKNPVVFLLWGKQAYDTVQMCDDSHAINKFAITSTHPSPFSANTRTRTTQAFIGSKPFSGVNKILIDNNATPINWKLD